MLTWRPFEKPVGEVTASDIRSLITREISEGLFIEYKREWQSSKVARAVASFANSRGGGTLIVGIEADKLLPKEAAGVEVANPGELEERVVQTIRSSVAPTPSRFVQASVDMGGNRACLIVEVAEGLQPPYIIIGSGTVLVRTQTSSDPIPAQDRETIDRLFAAGNRGRSWAQRIVENLASRVDRDLVTLSLIPAVDQGLPVNHIIFRESFMQRMDELPERIWIRQDLASGHAVSSEFAASTSSTTTGAFVSRAYVNGMMEVRWQNPSMSAETGIHHFLESDLLLKLRALYENALGYYGEVGFFIASRIGRQKIRVARTPIELAELTASDFRDWVRREAQRSLGNIVYEPELGL